MRVMIIGDLGGQLVAASRIASNRGAKVYHVSDTSAAFRALRAGKGADIVLIDVNYNIKELVTGLESEHFCIPVVACGVEANKEKAVFAIKSGAKEYLPLPPEEELIATILETISGEDEQFSIVYDSLHFKKIVEMGKQIAPTEASVLITGASGTGKEVMARFIHANSKRSSKELISVNCAAIPENLLESELFGHEKGAFTGAIERRIGKFEEADGATLFLDEISEMDIKLQAKLLRAIQEKEIVRVGGNKVIPVNIRILATSNRNLIEEVRKGSFREDLFYRLNVINVELPPLKDRKEDIVPLSKHFVDKYADINGIDSKPLSEEAQQVLKNYEWPGNVRELENAIHRSIILASNDKIEAQDVLLTQNDYNASSVSNDNVDINIGDSIDVMEKKLISSTLNHYYEDKDKAARVLGITIKVLNEKLKQHKLTA